MYQSAVPIVISKNIYLYFAGMKLLISSLFLFGFFSIYAQKIEKYYDYRWQETEANYARFYSLIQHTDSGWIRDDYYIHEGSLQMRGKYMDSACKIASGSFWYYHPNKMIDSKGDYINGQRQGLWFNFHTDGSLQDSVYYEKGKKVGICKSWHFNGYLSDSAFYNADGSGVEVSWYDNGNPSSAGLLAAGYQKKGKWKFFHKNGQPSSLEIYDNGKLLDKQYFDEDGSSIADTSNIDRVASFPGGAAGWQKYLNKQLYFPDQYKFTNGDRAVVVVDATIDEDGNVQNVEVSTPFYPAFDQIAVKVIKRSPKWIPAIRHNRKVKYMIRQPVTFSQPE